MASRLNWRPAIWPTHSKALDYAEAKVATALNGEFVPARSREATPVKDGDRIEILAPRQGG